MTESDGKISPSGTFIAGLGAGATEAVAVVTPMEVIKIRLQAQQRQSSTPSCKLCTGADGQTPSPIHSTYRDIVMPPMRHSPLCAKKAS